jgi:hypothetical protein
MDVAWDLNELSEHAEDVLEEDLCVLRVNTLNGQA